MQLLQKWSMENPENVDEHARNVTEYINFLVTKYGFEILERIGGGHESAGSNGQVGPLTSDSMYLGQVAFELGVNVEHI